MTNKRKHPRRKRLTRAQLLSSLSHPMRAVTDDDNTPRVNLKPYVQRCVDADQLPTTADELQITGVFIGPAQDCVHVLLGWGERARQLAIVTRGQDIVGDYTLDMLADWSLYQLPRPKDGLSAATAAKVLNGDLVHFSANRGRDGYRLRIAGRKHPPHELIAALGQVSSLTMQPTSTAVLDEVLHSPALRHVQTIELKDVGRAISLNSLSHLTDLRQLTIFGGGGPRDLSFLKNLATLEQLQISGGSVESLDDFAGLKRLKRLKLHWFPKLKCYETLRTLKTLEKLSLGAMGSKRINVESMAAFRKAAPLSAPRGVTKARQGTSKGSKRKTTKSSTAKKTGKTTAKKTPNKSSKRATAKTSTRTSKRTSTRRSARSSK